MKNNIPTNKPSKIINASFWVMIIQLSITGLYFLLFQLHNFHIFESLSFNTIKENVFIFTAPFFVISLLISTFSFSLLTIFATTSKSKTDLKNVILFSSVTLTTHLFFLTTIGW